MFGKKAVEVLDKNTRQVHESNNPAETKPTTVSGFLVDKLTEGLRGKQGHSCTSPVCHH